MFSSKCFRKWISLSFTSFFFRFYIIFRCWFKGEVCYRCFLHHFYLDSNQWGHELEWDGSLWDHVGVPFSGDGGGGGGSSSSSGHSSHHRIEVPELTNSSLTSTSVNIIWQNNYTFAKNVRLYMNDVMIYQDIVKPSVNSFAVKDLLPNGVKYFFKWNIHHLISTWYC